MIRTAIGIALLVFATAPASLGQSLTVNVTDQASGVVARAGVSVIDTGKKTFLSRATGGTGAARFEDLRPGEYDVKVSAEGFETWRRRVAVKGDTAIDAVLAPRAVAEVVSITANFLAGSPAALEQTPGSMQIVSKTELERSRVFNFAEALRKVSGISIRSEEGFGLRPNISIRGSDPTRSRKVLLLEDGVPLSYAPYGDNSSYYHPPIERFESVEVLKGSGQISYGPVTVAGVVNYLTPNPPAEPTFDIKLTGGNRDYFNGSGGFGGTFGNTGVAIGFTRKQGKGSRDNIRAGVNDLSVKVIRNLNDANVLVLKYSHFDESSRVTYSGLTEAEFDRDPRWNPFRNDDLEFFREGFSVAHTGILSPRSSVTTTFYTSYFSRDWWRQSSNSNERPNRLEVDSDCTGMQDLNTTCGIVGTPRDFRTIGLEPRVTASVDFGGVQHTLTGGFRIHYETQNRRKYVGATPFSREDGSEITERNLRNTLALAGFFQNRFKWKNVSVTPGLRVERIGYERNNLLGGLGGKTSLTQLIPGIGVAYNPFSSTTIFAGVHRGFAPPSTSDILTNSGGVVELSSELSWNYEIGLRTRPAEFLNLETVFFRNDYENQIIPASVAGGLGSTRTNAGETLQQGFEFNGRIDTSAIFRSAYNLYFQTAYTFIGTAEFRGLRFSGISGADNLLVTGNRLPYVPKHLATTAIGFEYRGFHALIENTFAGRQFTDDLNTLNPTADGQRGLIGSQTYFNATANYRIERLKTTLFISGKNITDRLFVVDRTRGIYPSAPRMIQAGLKITF